MSVLEYLGENQIINTNKPIVLFHGSKSDKR